jgi:putative membrane protein
MTDTIKTELPTNIATELAKERTHAAYDRNLMAWIRTGLALIGFGIGIFEFSQKTGGQTIFRSSKFVGILLLILGIASMVVAIWENKLNHKKLLNPSIKYSGTSSLSTGVGYALIVIGIIAIAHIFYRISIQGI